MASQFLSTVKYSLLMIAAFYGPKVITDSGHWLGNVEEKLEEPPHGFSIPVPEPVLDEKQESAETHGRINSAKKRSFFSSFVEPESQKSFHSKKKGDLRAEVPSVTESSSFSSLQAYPITPMEEIFRFDHYPAWFVDRWPRVDTVQSEYPLRGYRVVALTGTSRQDLSGVLTCYFDEKYMQRIEFHGRTGDFTRLLDFLVRHYDMVPRKTSSAHQYLYETAPSSERNNTRHERSRLDIQPASVFLADRKSEAFEVQLVLFRPGEY